MAVVAVAASVLFTSCNSGKNNKITNYNDSISYALGVDYAANALMGMASTGETYNNDLFAVGFSDYVAGNPKIDQDKAYDILNAHFEKLMAERRSEQQQFEAMEQPTDEDNILYLGENAKKDGIKTTRSGLQYRVIKESKGEKPGSDKEVVRVEYTGRLIDGTVFDSSKDHGMPAEFALNQVISGWTEGLQLMPVGSIYEFTIPPQLGYGDREITGLIPANSILIFEVELLEILK